MMMPDKTLIMQPIVDSPAKGGLPLEPQISFFQQNTHPILNNHNNANDLQTIPS